MSCIFASPLLRAERQTDFPASHACQSYEIAGTSVTRACGRVASLLGLDSYHFGAVLVACSLLALIAGVA